MCERNNSAYTKVNEGGGRRCSRHWSRGSSAAHGVDHGGAGCVPAAHGGPWWSGSPPAACGGPRAGVGGCPKEAVTLWEAHAGAGFCQDLWTHGERSPCQSRFAGRTCDPTVGRDYTLWKGPMLEQFVKNCSPWERPTLEKFVAISLMH